MIKFKVCSEMRVATGLNKSKLVGELVAGDRILVQTVEGKIISKIVVSINQNKCEKLIDSIWCDTMSEIEDKRCLGAGVFRGVENALTIKDDMVETDMGHLVIERRTGYIDNDFLEIELDGDKEDRLLISEYDNAPFAFQRAEGFNG